MKRFNSLLWRGAVLVVLFVAASVQAHAQAGCTDSNACNFDAGAVTDDGSCTYTGWFIPLTVSGGPAIQACDAPAGYYFPDQTCVESVIAADPFCADPDFGTWDSLCEEAYNTCLGCTDPDFYIPYDIASAPAVEACAGSEPAAYYLPDQTCVESVIGSDDYCMTTSWDTICQNDLDICALGCEGDWHIPYDIGSAPAVYACTPPAGYYTPNQACVEETIAADPFCVETSWDSLCQNSLDQCTFGCNADWHIPIDVPSGPAVYDCTAPAGYWTPDQDCVEATIAADPFCVETQWDSLCQEDYNNCALGCFTATWYVPYEVGSGPAVLACSPPSGYYAPDAACLETVLVADNTCISDTWDATCQSELNTCIYGCPDAVWSLPYEVGSGAPVFDCNEPFGYYVADQACATSVLANSPGCATSWDASCQSEYNICFLGCADAEWHIPLIVGDGPAVFECFTPTGYWTPDQACVQSVIAGDPFCTENTWDSICQDSYESCALGCVDAQWYIPTTTTGPALLACSQPTGYEAPASLDCFFDVAANDPFCTTSFWDSFCQSAYDACTNGCTYEFACNYSPTAIFDDGSCGEPGCTDPAADNYNPDAVCDDGGCVFGGGSTCQGDLDGNNIVNSADLLVFLSAFGNSCPAVGP